MSESPSVRPSSGWRRPGPWLLAGLLLAAAAIPGGLAAAHVLRVASSVGYGRPEASTTYNFTKFQMTDQPAYSPRTLAATAAAGTVNVNVLLNNSGSSLAHTFTLVNVSQVGIPVNRTLTPTGLTSYFATYPPTVNTNVSAGKIVWANFSLPADTKFRSLEFVSTIPYQFQAGMFGFLNITPAGPTYLLEENATSSFQFVPNELSSPPGANGSISFHVHVFDVGTTLHSFTVSSQPNVTFASVAALLAPPGFLRNVTVSGGNSTWANFTVPGIGVYEYVCVEPGHFSQGMFGFLYAGVTPPPTPAPPRTSLVEIPVLIGSAILLGIGIALALGSALIGRFPPKPESKTDGPHH